MPVGSELVPICICGETMERVFGKVKFILEGNGWAGKSRI